MLTNPSVFHSTSLAKYAVAFLGAVQEYTSRGGEWPILVELLPGMKSREGGCKDAVGRVITGGFGCIECGAV